MKTSKKGGFFKRTVAVVTTAAIFGGVAGGVFNLVAADKLNGVNEKKNISKIVSETLEGLETADVETTESKANNDDEKTTTDEIIQTASSVDNNYVSGGALDVSKIAENVMPSIVAINVKGVEQINQGMFGTYEYETEGAGSGIIIGKNDTELLIVTNNHVVASAETVSVVFNDGESYDAKVKSVDSSYDLAIVVVPLEDISGSTKENIKVANIGDSNELKVGEQVVAIGNALGYGQSVTTGIVSAKERTTDTNDLPLIQTDAAINPGNSGGALLNMKGELVGINSSKYASTEVEGMGYAIPISEVEEIIDGMVSRKTREKVDERDQASLGIKCGTVTADASELYGIPTGVLVSEVIDGSAAQKAGIKKNYIITKFDGQTVSTAEGLVDMLEYYKAGEKIEVTVKYMKDNEYVEDTIVVKLGKKN
ncbi:MAG: trypsin-like peptidase domain-containing protein [Lachnospiraceae bacterium]|nr:trypsin-like peptidase domain-containing protein [Lachnospiraceae bacterium]